MEGAQLLTGVSTILRDVVHHICDIYVWCQKVYKRSSSFVPEQKREVSPYDCVGDISEIICTV